MQKTSHFISSFSGDIYIYIFIYIYVCVCVCVCVCVIKCKWLENASNYFVTCKYFRLILQLLATSLTGFTSHSFNLIFVVICDTCKEEYIGDTREGKTKVRDRVRVYRQHIRQPQYQQLKVEEHLRVCGNGEFWVFPLLQIRS